MHLIQINPDLIINADHIVSLRWEGDPPRLVIYLAMMEDPVELTDESNSLRLWRYFEARALRSDPAAE